MYSIRSPFLMAPVIDRPILVVTHGSPSDPEPQEVAVQALATRLGQLMPEVQVRGATLAAEGALARAVQRMDAPILCPWFMSDGWFVKTHLPKRLKAAGLSHWRATAPMGLWPGLPQLMHDRLRLRLETLGWEMSQTTVILAAHGSPSSDKPRQATESAAKALAGFGRFKAIRPCYVDEPPAIRDVVASVRRPAIVLPFFAARAGHVTDDLPEELQAARFDGPVLEPVGTWPETPALALAVIGAVYSAELA
ncbi:MAG: CbiX/SirB N-terminal domain-containing protein [Paracoccaceae bacterium]|nr:CbiX/SirB N-terminal domain-containing protein [Paracoccaceae bacterium]